MVKTYYFDVTADYCSVEAESEDEANEKIRNKIDNLVVDFEIYEVKERDERNG